MVSPELHCKGRGPQSPGATRAPGIEERSSRPLWRAGLGPSIRVWASLRPPWLGHFPARFILRSRQVRRESTSSATLYSELVEAWVAKQV
ncbi:hypothetical protein MTO96_052016 [Rhipicephalus appendiculatus]